MAAAREAHLMPVTNSDIARLFNKVADLLEILDEKAFRRLLAEAGAS